MCACISDQSPCRGSTAKPRHKLSAPGRSIGFTLGSNTTPGERYSRRWLCLNHAGPFAFRLPSSLVLGMNLFANMSKKSCFFMNEMSRSLVMAITVFPANRTTAYFAFISKTHCGG